MPKKYIFNVKYTIQHRIERSQTTKRIQYNIHDKMCELPKYISRRTLHGFEHIYQAKILKTSQNKSKRNCIQ